MGTRPKIIIGFLLVFALGLALGLFLGVTRGIPFVAKRTGWSIGILEGPSPFELTTPQGLKNPVFTASDVTDVPAEFVADPFMVINDSGYYLFFEVLNESTNQGDIGLAVSRDGKKWTYRQIIVDEPFHLSYPYVFEWAGRYYMIPESGQDLSVRLYRAVDFPDKWELADTLLTGGDFADPSLLRFDEKWWLFVYSPRRDALLLYSADDLAGPWAEHPASPIVKNDPHIARPGGRVLPIDSRLFRFAQDDYPRYGLAVHAFEITELTPTAYREIPHAQNPLLEAGDADWNRLGMHNIDLHRLGNQRWLACVDGNGTRLVFGLKY